jgi:hypothetical protein
MNTRWSGSHDETEVAAALFGAYGVTNAVGLYVERGRETFDAVPHHRSEQRHGRCSGNVRFAGVPIGARSNLTLIEFGIRYQCVMLLRQTFPIGCRFTPK